MLCSIVLCVLVPTIRVDSFSCTHKRMSWANMPGTTLAAGVPHCWQLPLGPHPDFLSRGTVNVVDHTAAKLSWSEALRASSISPGSADHSSQPALAATPQAPPPTLQAPIPKSVPRRGVKRTLQKFMDQLLKPTNPAIDDMESDAIVVLTGGPELPQLFQQKCFPTKTFFQQERSFSSKKIFPKIFFQPKRRRLQRPMQPHRPILTLSMKCPQHIQEFKVVWTRKKKLHTVPV